MCKSPEAKMYLMCGRMRKEQDGRNTVSEEESPGIRALERYLTTYACMWILNSLEKYPSHP